MLNGNKPTERQLEILALMAQGNSYKEIAVLLFLETVTVRNNMSNLYKRTGITSYGNPGYKAVALYVSGYWS